MNGLVKSMVFIIIHCCTYLNSCLVVQNFKIALISIGFIVDLLNTLVALK